MGVDKIIDEALGSDDISYVTGRGEITKYYWEETDKGNINFYSRRLRGIDAMEAEIDEKEAELKAITERIDADVINRHELKRDLTEMKAQLKIDIDERFLNYLRTGK